jgi:hypothetical protein
MKFMSFIKPINKVAAGKDVKTKSDKTESEGDGVLVKLDDPGRQATKLALRAMGKGGKGKTGMKPVKVWLWSAVNSTSAATTAQAPVFQLFITNSAEATSLIDLFDQFKVEKVHFSYVLSFSTSSNGVDLAVAYDPANAGAYASVQAVLPARWHKQTSVGGNFTQPSPHTPDGRWHFHVTLPKGPFTDAGGSSATGDWADTANASTIDYGFIKGYVNAASAGTTSLTGYIGMLTSFRMRS